MLNAQTAPRSVIPFPPAFRYDDEATLADVIERADRLGLVLCQKKEGKAQQIRAFWVDAIPAGWKQVPTMTRRNARCAS